MPGRARRGNRLSMWLPRRFSRGCRYDADRPPRRRGPRLHGERAMIRRVTNRYRRLDPRGAALALVLGLGVARSEEHTSELQSLMRISYAVFCLKKNKNKQIKTSAACSIQHQKD